MIEEDNSPDFLLPSNGGKNPKHKGMYEDEDGNNLGPDFDPLPPPLSPGGPSDFKSVGHQYYNDLDAASKNAYDNQPYQTLEVPGYPT